MEVSVIPCLPVALCSSCPTVKSILILHILYDILSYEANTRWIVMTFGSHIYVPLRMSCLMPFPEAPSAGENSTV